MYLTYFKYASSHNFLIKIIYKMFRCDSRFWAGHYGMKFSRSCVTVQPLSEDPEDAPEIKPQETADYTRVEIANETWRWLLWVVSLHSVLMITWFTEQWLNDQKHLMYILIKWWPYAKLYKLQYSQVKLNNH